MAIIFNTAEAGVPSGTLIQTLDQTGGTAGTAFDRAMSLFNTAGGVTFSNERAAHGALGYRWGFSDSAGTGGFRSFDWVRLASPRMALRWYGAFSALAPSGMMYIGSLDEVSIESPNNVRSHPLKLARNADGTIQAMHHDTVVWVSEAVLQPNTMYRFEMRSERASGVGVPDGVDEVAVYLGDSPEPLPGGYYYADDVDNYVYGDRLFGGATIGQYSSGLGQTPYTHIEWIDDAALASDEDARSFIGPVLPPPVAEAHPYVVTRNPGLWFATGGGDLVSAVSDDQDATFAESPGAGPNEVLEYAAPPLLSGSLRVLIRAARGTDVTSLRLELLQGPDQVVASRTFELTETPTDFELIATPEELATITDRSKLRARIVGNPA